MAQICVAFSEKWMLTKLSLEKVALTEEAAVSIFPVRHCLFIGKVIKKYLKIQTLSTVNVKQVLVNNRSFCSETFCNRFSTLENKTLQFDSRDFI